MTYNFIQLQGWRRRGLAALLGVLAAGALPPCYILPLLIPAFSGLFLLTLNARNARQAFFDGWWWGLGHFTAGLYWICISLYVEPEKFAWLTPFALFGLPSIIAIYIGLVTLALYRMRARRHTTLVMLFALLWIIAEYARAHLFTGFPWNLIGYVWNASDITLQSAHFWGIYGQGWLAVTLATLPALFAVKTERPLPFMLAGIALFAAVIAAGAYRLAEHPTLYTTTTMRIVQANIAQSMKFNPKTLLKGLRKHTDLTARPAADKIDIVVWPETAVPYIVDPDSELTTDLGSHLPLKTLLFTGGMRSVGKGKNWQAWNSAFVLNHEGAILGQYDKYHLVPFGEYIPFRGILPIEAIAGNIGDFSDGPGPATLTPEGVPPFSPLICYEAIFPGRATDGTGKAQWIANITNDAWFGVSTGPYQHFEMSRTRAVEEGLPLVRAANTGISAVTDAYGRVLQQLPLGSAGVIDTLLPTAADKETITSRLQNFVVIALAIASLCLIALLNRRFRIAKI